MTASGHGPGDGAPPAQDERVWTLAFDWTAQYFDVRGPKLVGSVGVVPASELARVREERDAAREALTETLSWQKILHPLPWHTDSDWTEEVIASDGHCIAKCTDRETAEAIIKAAAETTGDGS